VKAPKDRVVIERMRARYGTAVSRGDAAVYETADAAKAITRSHILIRNGLKEKEAKAGAAPTEAAPAAPAAETKPDPAEKEPKPAKAAKDAPAAE
jgi:hypothetical protein